LALTSLQLLPINYAGLLLILLGVALLVGEVFAPSFGVLGIGGAISLALGSLLLFDTDSSDLIVDRSIVFAAVGTLTGLMLLLGYLVVKSQRIKPSLGQRGMVGEVGEVRVKLNPRGKVFVHGEYWNAEADEELSEGERVEVVGVEGMLLKVRRLSERQDGK
jgi:membrane-bound serine protease (ClpP class)